MSGMVPRFLVIFQTSSCNVRNMTKNPGHIPDKYLYCLEHDQISWSHSGHEYALSGTPSIVSMADFFFENLCLKKNVNKNDENFGR